MDIQVSSNFERLLFEASGRDPGTVRRLMASLAQSGAFELGPEMLDQIRRDFDSDRVDEVDVASTIRTTLAMSGELLDPHTAIGVSVARRKMVDKSPMISLATAHPAKFPDAVASACGVRPELPRRLSYLLSAEEKYSILPNDAEAVKTFILARSAK
jgi:threonine synthase